MIQHLPSSNKNLAAAAAAATTTMSAEYGAQGQQSYQRQRLVFDAPYSRYRPSSRLRTSQQFRERDFGPLDSGQRHVLYTACPRDTFGEHEPVGESYAHTRTSYHDRRQPSQFDRSQLRNNTRRRAASESLLAGHRRGYDVPPSVPAPHHGPTVTREPINGSGANPRLARQDSLASYWLSCGSSISSVTTRHDRRAEFCFDWQTRSQHTLTTRGSIPEAHLALDPIPPQSEEERTPHGVKSSGLQPDEDTNMVTDSDESRTENQKDCQAADAPRTTIAPLRTASSPIGRRNQTNQTIDIGGGILLQLRGANETIEAIRNDFYAPCTCSCCEQTLFCILDAEYVVCPGCRVVSPLVAKPSDPGKRRASGGGGVGLGFTMEHLAHYQKEISRQMRT